MKNIYEEYFCSSDPQEIEKEKKKCDALQAIFPKLMNMEKEKINYVLFNNNRNNTVKTEKKLEIRENKDVFNISNTDYTLNSINRPKQKSTSHNNINFDTGYVNNERKQQIKKTKYNLYFGKPKNSLNFDSIFNNNFLLKSLDKFKPKPIINDSLNLSTKHANQDSDSLWYDNGHLNVTFRNDVIGSNDFAPYRNSDRVGCKRRCMEMLKASGGELSGARIDMTINDGNGCPKSPSRNFWKGIDAINKSLDNGKPIILNVDYKEGNASSADMAGDHFIIVVGKTIIDDITYYHFYDPATKSIDRGTANRNVLYVKDGYLSGNFLKYNGEVNKYKVTSVRLNK